MGQPSHPNGSRVNSIQVADNSTSWYGNDKAFFFQSYLLSILFKFIRHWLSSSLVIPYKNPWYSGDTNRQAKFRSRRARPVDKTVIPNLEWHNNVPRALMGTTKGKTKRRFFNGVVFRYFRKLPPALVLRDSMGDLVRPSIIIKRPRYTFTFWNRPKLLRCTNFVFCIIKGVGAGEKLRKRLPPKKWRVRVKKKGTWKKLRMINANTISKPSFKYWKNEI